MTWERIGTLRGPKGEKGEDAVLGEHNHDGEYAEPHTHPYASDSHTHPASVHPDLAMHEALGLAAEAHDHDSAYSAQDHGHPLYATDSALTSHAETAHGLATHAIDGAFHTGVELLPSVGQKNALAGSAGTPGLQNAYVTEQDSRLGDSRTPVAHSHPEAEITGLLADLIAKADAVHSHIHTHTLADADIPAAIARDSEVTAAVATHAATPHLMDVSAAWPVGSVFLSVVATSPATLLGFGTWAAIGAGKMLMGWNTGDTLEATGGAATHSHSFNQPGAHSDHGALSHSVHAGATVGNHAFTQPGAHTDHAALAHSAHAGATVADHAAHTHTFTGSSNATTPDLLTANTAAAGVSASGTTGNPNATQTHTVGQASAHSDHATQAHSAHSGGAVDAHSVGQANAHSDHGAQSHSAHAGGAVADGSSTPPYLIVRMWKRTA